MEKQNRNHALVDLLLEIDAQMHAFQDIDQLIAFFVNKIAEIFRAGRVSFMLLDETRGELFIKASHGLDFSDGKSIIRLGEMFGGWVAKQGKPLLVKDVEAEFPDLIKNRVLRCKTKSFIIVPVKVQKGIFGILNMTDKKDLSIFTEEELNTINLFCHYFALHVENIRLLENNAKNSTIDALTGLFNHRYFQDQLLEEIYRAERYRCHLSLAMLDIDNFCWYNQTYGYSAGDSALSKIGKLIKENTRRVDTSVRYGPEEFMLILPNTRLKQAIFVGEKIRETVGYSVFAEDRSTSLGMARLTVSIGVVEHKVGVDKEELTRRVVSALLEAKQKGKNRVCVFK
ncbi:diguanylate cyclase [Candidatus Omnitrophota bacterium]